MADTGVFQINDIVLNIPPGQISITRQSFNNQWQTLRTRSSTKTKSGFSQISIAMNVSFTTSNPKVGNQNGFEQLRDLVAQFKVTPFCYVDNEYIRNTVLGGDRTKSMALALRQLELRTVPSNTNLIEATFNFVWFNYEPYVPDFTFKDNPFMNSAEVKDPRNSKAWRLMYKAEQRRWDKRSNRQIGSGAKLSKFLDSKIEFEVAEYNVLSIEKYNKLWDEYQATKVLSDQLFDLTCGGTHDGALNQFVFRSLKDRLKGYSDIEINSLTEELFGSTTSMLSSDDDKKVLYKLLEALNRNLFPDNSYKSKYQIFVDDRWKVVLNKNQQSIKLGGSPTERIDPEGKKSPKDDIIVARTHTFDTSENNIVVTSISLSFEDVLATIPLNGHKFPTYQHIGSTDAVVTISMETTSAEAVKALVNLYDMVESQSYKYRNIPQGHRNLIVKYNNLLGMFGLCDFIPENLSATTIPGNPGTTSMVLTLIDSPLDIDTAEKFSQAQSFTTTAAIRKAISDVLLKNLVDSIEVSKEKREAPKQTTMKAHYSGDLGIGQSYVSYVEEEEYEYNENVRGLRGESNLAGHYAYTGPNTDGRDDVFKHLCIRYGTELSKTVLKIRDVLKIKPGVLSNDSAVFNFYAFYGLDDNDTIAVERMQEDILPTVKALGYYNKTIGNSKGLNMLRSNVSSELERKLSDIKQSAETIHRIRNAGIDSGGGLRAAEAKFEADTAWVNALQTGDVFRREYLADWDLFAGKFINEEIIASGLIYTLPQFKKIRENLKDVKAGSTGNNYPDFPLEEVVELLRAEGGDEWNLLTAYIDAQLERDNARFKGLDITSFLQPDFYFFNKLDAQGARLITKDIVKQASDAIVSSHSQRKEVEDSWFDQVYNKRLGANKLSTMYREINTFTGERDKRWTAESGPSKESADKIRSLITRDYVWESDYMTPDERGLQCSSASEINLYNAAVPIKAIDPTSAQNTLLASRNATNLVPPTYSDDCQHRFGLDAIKYLGKLAYGGFSYHPESIGGNDPNFIWPCEAGLDGCSSGFGPRIRSAGLPGAGEAQFHTGIDIVSGSGGIVDHSHRVEGSAVMAAAPGFLIFVADPEKRKTAKSGAGNSVTIDHGNGWTSQYMHMLDDEWIRKTWRNQKTGRTYVKAGTRIGSIGSTGGSTGPHLHFEIRHNRKAVPPRRGDRWHSKSGGTNPEEGVIDGDFFASTRVQTELNGENESLLTRSVDQFEKTVRNGQGPSMMRAYPTFRLYFIESDLGERRRFGFDDFFSYSAVKEIQVVRSRKLATDLCIIQLTNVSGVLSNRKFGGDDPQDKEGKRVEEDPFALNKTNTVAENPIASLMLQPGIQIQLRLGYNSNPEELEKVFNGVISDVEFTENDDMVTIVCQSFAVEMVQDIHGQAVTYGGWFSSTGRTGKLLEEMMSSPEMVHFGKWEGGKAKNTARNLLTDRWAFFPQPQDDNIFAPTGPGEIIGIFDATSKYILYQSTIWDVFQEMTLRHPGYVAYPVPYEGKYGPRMTMFFGLPNQLYFARDPSFYEDGQMAIIDRALEESAFTDEEDQELLDRWTHDPSFSPTEAEMKRITALRKVSADTKEVVQQWVKRAMNDFALDKGIIRPFRSYHLLTGSEHIMFNNISSSTHDTFNVATIQYSDDEPKADEDNGKINFDDPETFTLACDAGIPDEDKRELFAQYPNCVGFEMAKRYALSILANSLKEGYRGSLVIIGNPSIKPYDICYIFDEYTDMVGPIEVEQVVHKFSQQNGFITEIVPDMCIQVNQHATMASQDAMGLIVEHYLGQSVGSTIIKGIKVSSMPLGSGPTILSNVFNKGEQSLSVGSSGSILMTAGAFIFSKFIARSQLAHPFRYSPLVKNGKAMVGGFPTRIIDGGFLQGVKRWIKDWDKNIGLAWDDFYDKIHPNNWANKTQGDLNHYLFGGD